MSDLIERLRNLAEDQNGLIHGMPRENTVYHEAAERIEQLQDKLVEVEQERDALAANFERLRVVMGHGAIIENEDVGDVWGICPVKVDKVLRESPQTSLAERDARIIEEAFITGAHEFCGQEEGRNPGYANVLEAAKQYANKLREQSK